MKKRLFIVVTLILSIIFCGLHNESPVYAEENWPQPPTVYAESAIVMEADSGAILYEKNSKEQRYPASITKVMTTLLALERCPLNENVLFSKDAVYNVEGTQVGITPNEEVPLEECLYGVMLASGNEIAYAVAEHVGGTYEAFVQLMNTRAAELGCENTHFNNPHGLPDENHYTCAYDMALIARQAYKNSKFKEISGTRYHIIPPTNLYGEERAMANHHKMLTNTSYHYDYCTGGKTGYTNAARYNLVTYAEKDGMSLICVIMKDQELANQYLDTTNLFNYCFDNFHKVNVKDTEMADNLSSTALFPLEKNVFTRDEGSVYFEDTASIIVPNTVDISSLSHTVTYNEKTGNAQDIAAYITYKYGEHLLADIPIMYESPKQTAGSTTTVPSADNNRFFTINVRTILYIVAGIVLVALIALAVLHFVMVYHFTGSLHLPKRKRKRRRSNNRRLR